MADPVSIAGLVIAVGQVIGLVAQYPLQVKNARTDIKLSLEELLVLQGVLVHIERQDWNTFTTGTEILLQSGSTITNDLLLKLQPKPGLLHIHWVRPIQLWHSEGYLILIA